MRLSPFTRTGRIFIACFFFLVAVSFVLPHSASAQFNRYDLQIPVPPETWLAADLYTPDSTVAMPVIFIQTPYNKNKYRIHPLPLNTEDYAWVIMDWRGFYGSQHAEVPFPVYGKDGALAIDWMAEQPWCNGKVATYGASALGSVQYLTAQYRPTHLVCSVPINHALQVRYLKYYHAGVKRTEYIDALGGWNPVDFLVNRHPMHDWFWTGIEWISDFSPTVTSPFLIISGWWDMNPDEALITYEDLVTRSDPRVRDDHRILIGPWSHSTVGQLNQGDWQFPAAVGVAKVAALEFIDYWMLDKRWGSQGLRHIGYFDLGPDELRFADTWPPTEVESLELYLNNQQLTVDPPVSPQQPHVFDYDPRDPVPTLGGRTFSHQLEAGPVDLNPLNTRDDVLIYQTPVLTEAIEVTGYIHANIFMSTNRLDTDVAVLLADVFPNGRARLITDGIRRLRFRDSMSDPQLGIPGHVYNLQIPLQTMAVTFLPGHRIRLYVSGSNYPRFDCNLNNGGPMYEQGDSLIATTRIYQDNEHSSSLVLSVPVSRTGGNNPAAGENAVASENVGVNATASLIVHPNPFNATTLVRIDVPETAELTVDVFNVSGQLVTSLANGTWAAGQHEFTLDGSALASGVYFVRATHSGSEPQTRKILLLR